jgi:AAA+ superfamily predicted ATPase
MKSKINNMVERGQTPSSLEQKYQISPPSTPAPMEQPKEKRKKLSYESDNSTTNPENKSDESTIQKINKRRKPSPPEKESRGLEIIIEDRNSIYEAIKEGKSGRLGTTHLRRPIEKIEVHLKSEAEENSNPLAILHISKTTNPELNRYGITNDIEHHMEKIFGKKKVKEEGGIFTLTEGNTKFAIELNFKLSQLSHITINAGNAYYSNGTILELTPKPQKTKDYTEETLEGFIKLLRVCTNAIYLAHGEKIPDNIELKLHPPEEPPLPSNPITIFQKEPGNNLPSYDSGKVLDFKIKEPKEIQVSFDDISGQEEAKLRLKELILSEEEYGKFGTKPPKVIIIHGPPGTGKTSLVEAFAREANAKLVYINRDRPDSELEKIIKILSNPDKYNKRIIIFFHRLDEITPKTDEMYGPTQRSICTLLKAIDKDKPDNITVMGTINNPKHFGDNILNSGRLDNLIRVDLPKEDEREKIFYTHMNKAKEKAGRDLFGDIDLKKIKEETKGMSGAHIKNIITRVLQKKSSEKNTTGEESQLVNINDIKKQIDIYKKEIEDLLTNPNINSYL